MTVPPTTASHAIEGPQLRDIHLPPSPSWWPPAPGWWLLGALVLLVVLGIGWSWRRRHRRASARRRPLLEIQRLERDYARDGDRARLATGLHALLRRLALAHDPRAAHQSGRAWRDTLASVPVDAEVLARLDVLEEAIYRPASAFDAGETIAAVKRWVQLAADARRWQVLAGEPSDA